MKRFKEMLKDGTLTSVGGLALGVFSIYALFASVSYMLDWKQDQSLRFAQSFFDGNVKVANHAGGLGFKLGHLLVADCFGIAAIFLCVALAFLAYKLLLNRKVEWGRTVVYTVFGTFTIALALAWVGSFFPASLSGLFDGGLGGKACAHIVATLDVLVGGVFTIVLIAVIPILCAIILYERPKEDGDSAVAEPGPAVVPSSAAEEDEDDFLSNVNDVAIPEPEPVPEEEPVIDNDVLDDVPQSIAEPAREEEDAKVTINGPVDVLTTKDLEELPQLDIRSDVDRYVFPSLELLKDYADKRFTIPRSEIERNTEKIKATLASFKIPVESIEASVGYTVTLYSIVLGTGVRVNQVKNIEEDIAIKIGIKGVRVVILASAVGIEVPNDRPSVVPLKAILNSDAFRNSKAELPIAVGYTITTKAKVFDLAEAPHLLVAGATKQGKSVGLNAIISSLLYSKHPTELKFVFIDPKMVEFQQYSKLLDHYLALLPVSGDESQEAKSAIVTDPKNAEAVLNSLCVEMDKRYKLMSEAGVNKITDYNEKYRNRHLLPTDGHDFMPYLVVVVDEYADLTKSLFGSDRNLARSIENSINRLAAKGRAAGLHVIIATQRPSVDVITGTIKGNFPTRMAFRTAQRQDSQTILGIPGAERLIGKGDMLFFTGAEAERVQCALVDTDEIEAITGFIADQQGYHQRCTTPYYLPEPVNPDGTPMGGGESPLVDMKNLDPMFEEAARLAVMNQQISTSFLQRKMQLGFARAGRVMDQLESAGIVGPQNGSKSREVLVPDLATLQPILDAFVK